MEFFIQPLQHWIQTAGGLGVFGASLVEELISLIPSSVVQMGAGIFIMSGDPVTWLSIGKLILQISIPAALGVTIGSLPYVWLARTFGIGLIERYGKWVGVSYADIKKLEAKLAQTKWDDVAFVALRAFPAVPSVALAVYGGMVEMSWWRYMTLSFIGVFIRATGLGIVGWLFGATLERVSALVNHLETIGLSVLIVVGVAWIAWIIYSKRKKRVV